MSAIGDLLRSMDDAAWEALASKGLLRRAGKDLEKGLACSVIEETSEKLSLRVGEWTVTVPPEGPARARCSCGAAGCCHHIVAAGLHFRSLAPSAAQRDEPSATAAETSPTPPHETPAASPMALDYAAIKRWCSSAAWKPAIRLIAQGIPHEISTEGGITSVHLPSLNAACRFLPGAGLDGCIVAGAAGNKRKTIVAVALIVLKTQAGQSLPAEDLAESQLAEAEGAPRSRAEVLASTKLLLELAITSGLAHAGPSMAERFATLAVSAEGAHLPRLALSLKSVGDELRMVAERHGLADTERLLGAMAFAYALAAAMEPNPASPPPELVGKHRTGYLEVPILEIWGITAYPWRSRSGYHGITVLFWNPGTHSWLTWSDARSIASDPRFDPLRQMDSPCPWSPETTLRTVYSSRLQLSHAKTNAAGRLSSSQGCQARVIGPTPFADLNAGKCSFDRWTTLASHIADTSPSGLHVPDLLSDWVVLAPARWGPRRFDRVDQCLRWELLDGDSGTVTLVLPYTDMTRHSVDRLEQWEPPKSGNARVLGRVLRHRGEFAVEPVAILPGPGSAMPAIHLGVPETQKAPHSVPAASTPPSVDDEELSGEVNEQPSVEAQTDRWLHMARQFLVEAAESGPNGRQETIRAHSTALDSKLHDVGLPVLAKALQRTVDPSCNAAEEILKSAYLVRLHEQLATGGR